MPATPAIGAPLETGAATIASGETVSDAVLVGGRMIVGFQTDAAFDGTSLGLRAAADGSTYVAVKDPATGSAYAWTVAASGYYPVVPPIFATSIKFVAGTSQTGASVITLVFAP